MPKHIGRTCFCIPNTHILSTRHMECVHAGQRAQSGARGERFEAQGALLKPHALRVELPPGPEQLHEEAGGAAAFRCAPAWHWGRTAVRYWTGLLENHASFC